VNEFKVGDRVVYNDHRYPWIGEVTEAIDDMSVYIVRVGNYYMMADGAELQPCPEDPLPFGISSEQLADYVKQFVAEAMQRVLGVGQEQYDQGGHQRFETMDLDELFRWFEEEALDAVVYLAMISLRVARARQALRDKGVL